jgi:hypothetical protein
VITEEQFHEAVEVELLHENLQLWEERLANGAKILRQEYLQLDVLVANTKKLLKTLTGNERGFLPDNAPRGE